MLTELTSSERIQAAVVFRSSGNKRAFWTAYRVAREDWRDALVAGDLGGDGWELFLDSELGVATG